MKSEILALKSEVQAADNRVSYEVKVNFLICEVDKLKEQFSKITGKIA